jgi:hypothetical protein
VCAVERHKVPRGNVKNVAELLLCLPGSSASIERVFSHMNCEYIWSEEKSRFHVDKTQAILAVKTNNGLSCEAFSEELASSPEVMKKIHSSDKCHVITRTSSTI